MFSKGELITDSQIYDNNRVYYQPKGVGKLISEGGKIYPKPYKRLEIARI